MFYKPYTAARERCV